ncbi:MAG: DUF2796 domain-containing protein [Litorimonas sp.]
MTFKFKPPPPSTISLASILCASLLLVGCSQPDRKKASETNNTLPAPSAEMMAPKPIAEASPIKPLNEDVPSVRSADSHVHGGAILSIASENDTIQIEFETPLYNLLGFEYAPKSDAEKALVSEAEVSLTQPEILIRFNDAAKCSFETPSSNVDLFETHSGEEDDEHHDDHDHSDHHEEESETDDHDEHHQHEENSVHKDVLLNYFLSCGEIDKLKTVKVELFEIFPNLTELELVYLGPSQQMSADLTPSKTTAELTR